jgi:hypothetical protein
MKIEGSASGSGSESGFGSISQRHGSADPNTDPHQNVMDPQHCRQVSLNGYKFGLRYGTVPNDFVFCRSLWVEALDGKESMYMYAQVRSITSIFFIKPVLTKWCRIFYGFLW